MEKNKTALALACMVVSSIMWGSAFVSSKVLFEWFTPYSLLKYRLLISTATLLVIVIVTRRNLRIKREDIPRIALCGFLGIFLYYLMDNVSLLYISPSTASILVGAAPVISLLCGLLAGREKIRRNILVAALLSTLGIVMVVGLQGEPVSRDLLLGIGCMILGVSSWVAFGFLSFSLAGKYDEIVISFYQILSATIVCTICFWNSEAAWSEITTGGIGHLIFLGAACSGICYVLYNFAVRTLRVTVSNILMNLCPLVTIGAEMVVLGIVPTAATVAGGVLIVLAATISVWPSRGSSSGDHA